VRPILCSLRSRRPPPLRFLVPSEWRTGSMFQGTALASGAQDQDQEGEKGCGSHVRDICEEFPPFVRRLRRVPEWQFWFVKHCCSGFRTYRPFPGSPSHDQMHALPPAPFKFRRTSISVSWNYPEATALNFTSMLYLCQITLDQMSGRSVRQISWFPRR
jgi:hypothetical protein